MNTPLRRHTLARALSLCLLAPAAGLLALPAAAATAAPVRVAPAPVIHNLQVDADSGLGSGSQLQFTVEGTPRAQARIGLSSNRIAVALRETSPGIYQGQYTVRRADRIDPAGQIRVTLTSGKRSTLAHYNYPQSFLAVAPPPVLAPLAIERFAALPVNRLEPGAVLRFRLDGAPGANASFAIPGVVDRVAMQEQRPGHYTGSYTVRRSDNLDAIDSAVATLRDGPRVVTASLNRMPVADNSAPVIGNLTPHNNETVPSGRPVQVGGSFDDAGGRGIDPASVKILLSGRDVTDDSRITTSEFSFRGPLPPGRHTAEVTARDRAGNTTTKSWSFDVGSAMGAAPAMPLPLQLLAPGNNAVIDSDRVTVQGRTAPGATVRIKVNAVLPASGNRMAVAEPVLTQNVQADANGVFSFNLGPRRFTPPGGTRFEVTVEALRDGQSTESRLVLFERG